MRQKLFLARLYESFIHCLLQFLLCERAYLVVPPLFGSKMLRKQVYKILRILLSDDLAVHALAHANI